MKLNLINLSFPIPAWLASKSIRKGVLERGYMRRAWRKGATEVAVSFERMDPPSRLSETPEAKQYRDEFAASLDRRLREQLAKG